MMKMKLVAIVVLLVAFVSCRETLEDDTSVSNVDDHKEKRGISLNLGQGLEGYSYLGPSSSYSRGYPGNRGYTPITEFGYDGVNYGGGSSNFAGGYQGGYQGYNQPSGSYPYRGYPTSYSYQRQYNTPVNTYPLGGIGTVGPYGGGAYGGFSSGFNQFGSDGQGFGGGYPNRLSGYPQQQQGGYPQQQLGGYPQQQQQGYY